MAYAIPRSNPLGRSPIRTYLGPLPSRLPGLGQVGTAGGCPGSPGCPGYVAPVPSVSDTSVGTVYYLPASAPSGSTFTDWLNQNASTVVWIGGIAVGVLLLSRLR